MTSTLWLSILALKRNPEIAALARTLLPEDAAEGLATHHRLVWSAFADQPDRPRDFLWRREDAHGRFVTLSARPPRPNSTLFDVRTKPFEPALTPGDRLGFTLRLNPTVERKEGGRSDVVMDRLKPVPSGKRAAVGLQIAEAAARDWPEARAARDGVRLDAFRIDGYRAERLGRGHQRRKGTLGVVDAQGALTVENPNAFLARLATGFGRERAFGCGLMLIRRFPVAGQ